MKNVAKRALCMLLIAILVLSMVPVRAMHIHAVESEEVFQKTFTADDFTLPYASMNNGDRIVEDADAYTGKAVVADYAARVPLNDTNMLNALTFGNGKNMKIHVRTDESIKVGEIAIEDLRANMGNGYFTYTFANVMLVDSDDTASFLYFFEDWSIQLKLNNYLEELRNQYVDITMSMKITGNVSSCVDYPPVYYIDKVTITTTGAEIHNHTYGDWTYVDENTHTGTCECSDVKTEAHAWDEGVASGDQIVYTCTVCQGTKTGAPESNALNLTFLADQFTTAYGNANGDCVIDDPESAVGKAVFVTYAGRAALNDAGMMNALIFGNGKPMRIYAQESSGGHQVAEIAIEDLRANMGNGYFTYIFPNVQILSETDTSVFLYFFEDWSIQLKLNDYVDVLKGKTVDFVVSMKITGDVSNRESNSPCYYIDKVIIADEYVEEHIHTYSNWTYVDENTHTGTCDCADVKTEAHDWDDGVASGNEIVYTCSVCQGTKTETVESDVLMLDFRAADFYRPYGDPIVDDSTSAYGSAAKYSYADRFATGDQGLYKAMIRVGEQVLDIRTNNNIVVGNLSVDQLLEAGAKGEYVVYEFTDVVLTDANFIYIFDCWGFQVPLTQHKDALRDLPVNVYVSMKITGDVTNTTDNTPTYYIDRVVITTGTLENEHTHSYNNWTSADENNHTGTCDCGDVKTEAHDWDDGVTSGSEIVYTCSICQGTKTEAAESDVLMLEFKAADFYRPYGDPIVDDSTSAYGQAAKYSYADRFATGDQGLYKAMIRVGEQTLEMYSRVDPSVLVGTLTVADLNANSGNGYILYEFTNVDIMPVPHADSFLYLFDCWGFQVKLNDYKDVLTGKKVNVYLSMKITGDVTNTTDNTPTYYIDRVVITTGTLGSEHTHSYSNWTYVDENNHTGTCDCGDVKTEAHDWDDGVASGDQILYTCSICQGTKTGAPVEEEELTLIFTADDFTRPYAAEYGVDPLVIDSNSRNGKAVMYSFADRKVVKDINSSAPSHMAMIRVEPQTLDVRTNNNIVVGIYSIAELNEISDNGGYVLRKFSDIQLADANFIYIFDCWGFQVPLAQYKDALRNVTVNVYVSMRITGNVSNTGSKSPVYYIDEVVITTGEYEPAGQTHIYGDWEYMDENNHSASCSHCDDVIVDAHDWDEGEVTLKPTEETEGERTHTCTLCGGTKIEPINKVNPEGINIVFYPDQFYLAYGDPIVNDSSAEGGKAAKFDYAARFATGDKGLYNALIFGGDHMLDVRTNNNVEVGRLSAAKLQKNADKGKYLTYKFSNINLTGAGFIYIFDCWGFQVKLGEYADILRNEKVYVYVTLKVTGVVGDRENDTPTYYISKVEISSKNRSVDSDKKDPVNMVLTPSDFAMPYATDSIQSDSQSKYGKAAVFSYEKRYASGDKGLYNAMIFGGERALELYTHGGDPKQGYLLGSISNEQMNYHANKDGYVVYTFKNVKMVPTAGSYLFYMFDCWGMNIRLTEAQVEELQGRRVDISVSMKITGNVMNPNNPPTYYIDYIKIVSSSGSGCVHDYGDWTLVDGKDHSATCFFCGQVKTEEHKWDDGVVVEGLPEGHKLFTCADCLATSQGEQPGQDVNAGEEEEHVCAYSQWTTVDDHQHTAVCTDCGEAAFENHAWDAGVVAQEATTEKAGEKLYTCSVCGATKSEVIDKLTADVQDPVDVEPFMDSDTLTWIIMAGVLDLVVVIFLIFLLKKRKK